MRLLTGLAFAVTCMASAFGFAGFDALQPLLFGQQSVVSVVDSRWLVLAGSVAWTATGTALAAAASKLFSRRRAPARGPRQLGPYTLEEKIGEGGMGEVYRARHAMLRRPTAIKLLHGDISERKLRRFETEVQLTAGLTHPNTISVYDYGRAADGTFYYAMELLEGATLQQLVERHGPQSPARVVHILLQVCAALREAHQAGLIHRDIKPDNVFLCRQGAEPDRVKVLDFGLVKQIAADAHLSSANVDTVVGTPLYMSPEAISAPDRVDARADLYALGAVGYFLLTGTAVFSGSSLVEVCGHHLHSEPEPVSRRTSRPIPADLERLLLDCLAKDPAARPQHAEELARRLRECSDSGAWSEHDAERWWHNHDARLS
jgi:eukaryotic-like serine/threonine-protein kinase